MNLLNLKEKISGKLIELFSVMVSKIITFSNGLILYLKVCKVRVKIQKVNLLQVQVGIMKWNLSLS
jgi:hypothetical protein